MRIPRVYSAQPLALDQPLDLSESASHYLLRVLRLTAERPVIVFNGEGGEYHGHICDVSKKRATVLLQRFEADDRQSPLTTELAVGLSRGERWDTVLQKATELGVHRIVPLITERTEVKLKGDRLAKKQQHWQQICISACEQSQRNIPPELAPLTTLEEYLPAAQGELKMVLHHRDSKSLADQPNPGSVSLLIGPEGGLSPEEIESACTQGFSPLTLGPRVLRTETAPLVALSLVQYRWGDLQ